MKDIKFGRDGWRGLIADDVTFESIKAAAQGIADYINEKNMGDRGIVIGYDNRFLSPEFAKACSSVLTANNIRVYITKTAVPAPALAFECVRIKAAGAVMITASHKPGTYNGIKFFAEHGGPANLSTTDKITEYAKKALENNTVNDRGNDEWVRLSDPKDAYIESVSKLVDLDIIRKSGLKIVYDPMFGTGIGYTAEILEKAGCKLKVINNYRDPLFGGIVPDTVMESMEDLAEAMKAEDADLGLATGGGGERFGVIDKKGNYISHNEIVYLLADYLSKSRNWKSAVARTVATTHMVDRVAEKNGFEVIETPVGFKYIAEAMMTKNVFLGGEEPGGLSIAGHIPEKDGILACLLVAEMVARSGKSPTELIEDLKKDIGYLYSKRLDIYCSENAKERVLNHLQEYHPDSIAGLKVTNTVSIDGQKYLMEDGSWVLIRASGSESLFRVYAESSTMELVDQIQSHVRQDLKI